MLSLSDGFIRLVKEANCFISSEKQTGCLPFIVDGKQVGLITPHVLKQLKRFPDVFVIKSSPSAPPGGLSEQQRLHLSEDLTSFEERSEKVAAVLEILRKEDHFVALRGWRNEEYDVLRKFSERPLLKIERAATSLFGMINYGTHVNGYTYDENNRLMMWIGRRAKTKATWPGKLDNMCAGGLPSGMGVRDCLVKECQEEASVPLEYMEKLQSVGCISYFHENERGLFPENQFVYDLELPHSFMPVNADGEVEDFQLVTIEQVKEMITTDHFKFNCALIILDFLIRRGYITADNEANYAYLIEQMHYPLQSIYEDGGKYNF